MYRRLDLLHIKKHFLASDMVSSQLQWCLQTVPTAEK